MRWARSWIPWWSVLAVVSVSLPVHADSDGAARPAAAFAGETRLEPALPWQGLDAELAVSRQALASHQELFGAALTHAAFGFERRTSLLGSLDLLEPTELWPGRAASLRAKFAYDALDRVEQPLLARHASSETTPTLGLRAELGGLALEGELARAFSRDAAATTRAQADRATLRAELAPRLLLGDAVPLARWLPTLRGSVGSTDAWVRSRATRFGTDGHSATERIERTLGAEWSGARWLVGLGWSESWQRAGEAGAAAPPTTTRAHSLTLGAWSGEAFSLWLALSRTSEHAGEAAKRLLAGSLALDWRFAPGWRLGATLGPSWERAARARARRWTATTELAWVLPRLANAPPAQAALRLSQSRSLERGSERAVRDGAWTLGLALVIPTF